MRTTVGEEEEEAPLFLVVFLVLLASDRDISFLTACGLSVPACVKKKKKNQGCQFRKVRERERCSLKSSDLPFKRPKLASLWRK